MTALLRSTCPGCKNALRIPADWLHQQIRCKHCGTVLQAHKKSTPVASTAAPAAENKGSPFTDLRSEVEPSAPIITRRRRRSSPWPKITVAAIAAVTVTLLVVATIYRQRFLDLLPAPDADIPNSPAAAKAPKSKSRTPLPSHVKKHESVPRRALLISIHDYLYANPILDGPAKLPSAHNLKTFTDSLNRGLNISLTQIAHLSDDSHIRGQPRAPTKAVIEQTLMKFLSDSRAQDRILVFFIGHSVEMGDEVYLAPIEAELDKAATMIPLSWFFEQMAACKARQKVLVLDVNRYDQTFGQERPGGGAMGPKLDAMLKTPPPGVQVWSACVAGQKSYATDDSPMGSFLDELQTVLEKGSADNTPSVDEPLPLASLVSQVNQRLKRSLDRYGVVQASRLTGAETTSSASFDPKEPQPLEAVSCLAAAPAAVAESKKWTEAVLGEIGTPPIKVTHPMELRYDALPPFRMDVLNKYKDEKSDAESPLRKAVQNARVTLWAIFPGKGTSDEPGAEPKELQSAIDPMRQRIKFTLERLRDGYRAPRSGGEGRLKNDIEMDQRASARIMQFINDALEEMKKPEVVEAKSNASKRWQVNYDLMLARVQLEYTYLFEYDSLLGQMRKEFPPLDANLHGGWKLASQAEMTGDKKGQKYAKDAHKLLDSIIKKHAGTPWAILAKREKLINLGLAWKATR